MVSNFTEEHRSIFKTAYLFRNLEPAELELFIDKAEYAEWNANNIVIREDDPGEHLFLLLSGKVRITSCASSRIPSPAKWFFSITEAEVLRFILTPRSN